MGRYFDASRYSWTGRREHAVYRRNPATDRIDCVCVVKRGADAHWVAFALNEQAERDLLVEVARESDVLFERSQDPATYREDGTLAKQVNRLEERADINEKNSRSHHQRIGAIERKQDPSESEVEADAIDREESGVFTPEARLPFNWRCPSCDCNRAGARVSHSEGVSGVTCRLGHWSS